MSKSMRKNVAQDNEEIITDSSSDLSLLNMSKDYRLKNRDPSKYKQFSKGKEIKFKEPQMPKLTHLGKLSKFSQRSGTDARLSLQSSGSQKLLERSKSRNRTTNSGNSCSPTQRKYFNGSPKKSILKSVDSSPAK